MLVRCSGLIGSSVALVLSAGLSGCGKPKQSDPEAAQNARQEKKRHEAACASRVASDRVKGVLFDEAVGRVSGDRTNLDTLADYSTVRMEEPTFAGWDPELDITKCAARLILMLPPGAERAFAGDRQLRGDIEYTAQPAADGSGYVYRVHGAEPIIDKLARFNLTGRAIRPPAAIDEPSNQQASAEMNDPSQTEQQPTLTGTAQPPGADVRSLPGAASQQMTVPSQQPQPPRSEPNIRQGGASLKDTGEATIRSFYRALEAGDGAAASAYIVPEKRASRAFAPEAMTRFYGRLPEPIQLTSVTPLAGGSYRVTYRYSAGRSRCSGSAVVSVVQAQSRGLIRSIRALNGC